MILSHSLTSLLLASTLSVSSYAQDRNMAPEETLPTLAEIALMSGGEFDNNSRDFDILLNAVQVADPSILEALSDPANDLTLFAPNDRAFIRLARDFGYRGKDEEEAFNAIVDVLTDIGNGDPIPTLNEVLLYHVVGESLKPFQVIFSRSLTTLQGGEIRPFFFILRDNEPDLRNPWLTWPLNVKASNGILHAISRVLIPVDL
ncbi:MAG: fasciclin domain-containing protein [Planctomycetota bacterium]